MPDYYNDLNSRIMTTHVTFNYTVPPLIAQTGYCNFDITASLNEVLALSTWVSGHIVAIIIDDNGSTLGSNRQVYAYQGGVYDPIMVVSA